MQDAEDTVRVSFEGEDAVGILYAADSGLMLVESKGTPTYPWNIPRPPTNSLKVYEGIPFIWGFGDACGSLTVDRVETSSHFWVPS